VVEMQRKRRIRFGSSQDLRGRGIVALVRAAERNVRTCEREPARGKHVYTTEPDIFFYVTEKAIWQGNLFRETTSTLPAENELAAGQGVPHPELSCPTPTLDPGKKFLVFRQDFC